MPRVKNRYLGRKPQGGDILHVSTLLYRSDLEALMKKTGEETMKDALAKAVEIVLKL